MSAISRFIGKFSLALASATLVSPVLAVESIKVGALFPLSGGSGPQGQDVIKAVKAMASTINSAGGVMGRPLEILARDDESTPAVGVSRASELVGEKVAVVVEGYSSTVTLATQPVFSRANILDITANAKADTILSSEANPLAIRLNSSNAQDGAVIAAYLAKDLKAQRIAFLTQNDTYGAGAQASIEDGLKKLGHRYENVGTQKFPFNQFDFRIALTTVASAKPDAVVLINANSGAGLPALIQQARRARLSATLVTPAGIYSPSVAKVAGKASDGVVGAEIYIPDVEPFASNPANREFVARLQQEAGATPDKFMAVAALSVQVWAMAANELKTLDREALAKRIRGGSFKNTIFGEVSFEPNGQMKTTHYLFASKDGKLAVTNGGAK